ncbi:MAG: Hpt domain-containing protein [Pseudomonadota bacterium]|nr:Hpt domain-containing protein [Pseudomonadota bacterium]
MSNQKDSSKAEKIRQELWKTFVYEIEELLESMEQQLLQLEGDYSNEDLIAGLFRTMHTVKGTCGMMGLSKVESFTHKAEDLLDSVRDGKAEMDGSILDLLFNVSDILKNSSQEIIDKKSDEFFEAPEDIVAQLQQLLNKINNLSPALEEALNNPPSMDDSADDAEEFDMFDELVTETVDALDELEKTCLELEISYDNKPMINDLFRCVHSLKGNLNLAGMKHATDLLHRVEDIIGQVRDGQCSLVKEHLDLLFQVGDFMRQHFQSMTKVVDFAVEDTKPLYALVDAAIASQEKSAADAPEEAQARSNNFDQISMVEGDGHIQLDIEYVDAYIELVIEQVVPFIQQLSEQKIVESELVSAVDDLTHAGSIVGALGANKMLISALDLVKAGNLSEAASAFNELKTKLEASKGNLDLFASQFVSNSDESKEAGASTPSDNATSVNTAEEGASNTSSSWTAETFFEALWTELSKMRKALDALANDKLSLDEVMQQFTALSLHACCAKELAVADLLQELKAAIGSNNEEASKLLQTIYTMCWDLEDEVSEQGQPITFVDVPKSSTVQPEKTESNHVTDQPAMNPAPVEKGEDQQPEANAIPSKPAAESQVNVSTPLPPTTLINVGELPRLDLTVDPLFVLDFIAEAREMIMTLEEEVASLAKAAGDAQTLDYTRLVQLVEDISFAAQGVDVFSVQELCSMQLQLLKLPDWSFDREVINEFIVDLYRIMVQVQDSIPESVQRRHHSDLNLSHVFKQWHAEQCLVTAPWLVRTFSGFHQRLVDVKDDQQHIKVHDDFVKLMPDFTRKVESFLFAAQFYRLSVTEKVILSVRDYIVRVGFDVKLLSVESVSLILNIMKASANLISEVSTEGEANEFELQQFSDQLLKLSEPNINSAFLASAKKFLLSGELPETLEVCLDDETLGQVAEALKDERNIYLLHVDVDHDDEMADKAFDLMDSGKFETLMSATDYVDDRSYFNCLVVSSLNVNTLTKLLKEIDASQEYMFLKNLAVPLEMQQEEFVSYVKPIEFQQEHLESLNESIAELVAAKSTVDQIALGMGQDDLYDQINAIISTHGNWDSARFAVQKVLRKFDDERKSLLQAQDHFSDILYNVQYGLRQLQEVPIAVVCDEIQKTIVNDAYFNADMSFTLDDPDLLIEYQHKIATQEAMINVVRFIHEVIAADSNCEIESQSLTLNAGEHLEDLVFRMQWSNDVSQYFRNNNQAWQSFMQQFSDLFNEKHVHEDRNVSFEEKSRSSVDLKIKRHLDILDAIVVRVMEDYYVIPTQLVQRIVNAEDAEEIKGSAMDESSMVKVEDKLYPVTVITDGQDKSLESKDQKNPKIVLLLQQERQICSLIVDELLGMQQVVLAPLHGELRANNRLQSCVVLGKDRIGFVLKSGAVFGQTSTGAFMSK